MVEYPVFYDCMCEIVSADSIMPVSFGGVKKRDTNEEQHHVVHFAHRDTIPSTQYSTTASQTKTERKILQDAKAMLTTRRYYSPRRDCPRREGVGSRAGRRIRHNTYSKLRRTESQEKVGLLVQLARTDPTILQCGRSIARK